MARVMTAAHDVCRDAEDRQGKSDLPLHRDGASDMPVLVAKNLLFWGSIALSLYGLYALVAAL
jgi:hypothetical protein